MTDDAHGQRGPGINDSWMAIISDAQSSQSKQPAEGSLNDPADLTQAAAVSGFLSPDHWCDVQQFQHGPSRFTVVSCIRKQIHRTATWPSRPSVDLWKVCDRRQDLSSRPFPRGNWGFARIEGLVNMVSWTEPQDNRVTQIWPRL